MRILILLLMICSAPVFAQPQKKHEMIKAKRAEFITRKIDLSADQAEKFWPIYYGHESKRKEIRKKHKALRPDKSPEELSEDEANTLINQKFKIDQEMVDEERNYIEELKKVISSQQIVRLHHAEEEFKKTLLKELKNRRNGQVGGPGRPGGRPMR